MAAKGALQDGVNRHKFLTFAEQLKSLDVHILRKVKGKYADEDVGEDSCHFYEALVRWKDCNISQDFRDFARGCKGLVENVPLLCIHQVIVIEQRNFVQRPVNYFFRKTL